MALTPAETATAAVMSSIAVALSVVAMVVPMASALQIVAAVPLAVVIQRHRTRALVAAAAAGILVAFVAAGTTTAFTVATSALLGGIVGRAKRNRGCSPSLRRLPSSARRWACSRWGCCSF